MSPRKLAGGSSKRLILEILVLIVSPKIHVFRFLPLPPFSFTIEGTLFFFSPSSLPAEAPVGASGESPRKLRCCRRHSVQTSSMSSCNGGCTSLGCLSDLCRRRSFICSWSKPLVGSLVRAHRVVLVQQGRFQSEARTGCVGQCPPGSPSASHSGRKRMMTTRRVGL